MLSNGELRGAQEPFMARSQSRLTAEIDFNRNGKQHGFIRLHECHAASGWQVPPPADFPGRWRVSRGRAPGQCDHRQGRSPPQLLPGSWPGHYFTLCTARRAGRVRGLRRLIPGPWSRSGGRWVDHDTFVRGYAEQLTALDPQATFDAIVARAHRTSQCYCVGKCRRGTTRAIGATGPRSPTGSNRRSASRSSSSTSRPRRRSS